MGTRAAILVYGYSEHGVTHRDGFTAVRLYRHWDGDPGTVLDCIARATGTAANYIAGRQEYLTDRLEREATAFDMPAAGFAEHVKFAGAGFYGPGIKQDTDMTDVGRGEVPAVYHTDKAHSNQRRAEDDGVRWGSQGDLEWMYLVGLTARTVTVYGGGYGDPDEHLGNGPVDPRADALGYVEEAKPRRFLAVGKAVAELVARGWAITPARRKGGLTRAVVGRLKYRALCELMADLKPEWNTEAVTGVTSGILSDLAWDRCHVLADALSDAGCGDDELLANLRSLAA
jgi:hypothetical protein